MLGPETKKLPRRPKEHPKEDPVEPGGTSVVFKHPLESERRCLTLSVQPGSLRRGTPICRTKRHIGATTAFQIVHALQLVVHRQKLPAHVVGMGQISDQTQHILQGSFGVNDQTTIGAARFVTHHFRNECIHSAENPCSRVSECLPTQRYSAEIQSLASSCFAHALIKWRFAQPAA